MISHRKRKPFIPRTGSILPESEPFYSHSYRQESETNLFQEGDQVIHKTLDFLNCGLPFRVIDIDGRQVLCSYSDQTTATPVLSWYDKSELKLVSLASDDLEYLG